MDRDTMNPADSRLPAAVENLLVELHADGNAPPPALVEEWCRAHPAAASCIRATVASLVQLARSDRPDAIGPYRIVRKLGEGGMGTVYLAEQHEPVRRQVALKLIKLGLDSRAVVTRFERERQALAWMDDDGIAKVFDCGTTPRGQPYFVMEYVDGLPLTDFCDHHRLSVAQRLELLQQVCAAVMHAHQKGVVHRDLKPSNVLVSEASGRWRVKIIDFGLAKALRDHDTGLQSMTAAGVFVGTPEYMAPEQADPGNLDIDTRADVYSLGVMLYELLTGELPFASERLRNAGMLELATILRETEPPKPSSRITKLGEAAAAIAAARHTNAAALRRTLRNELDWVVLKALEKDRARRYATADALADDLRRYLRDEALQAGPPSASYRLRKLVRRHRGQFAAVAVVLVTAVTGAVLALNAAAEARANLKDAVAAKGLADDQRKLAEKREEDVRQVAEFQTRMLSTLLVDDFAAVVARLLRQEVERGSEQLADPAARTASVTAFDAAVRRANMTNVARTALRETLMEPAVTAIAKYADRGHLQPMLQLPVASTCNLLGMLDLGERLSREALARLEAAAVPLEHEILHAKYVLGFCLENAGQLAEAESLLREVVAGALRTHGPAHGQTALAKNHLGVVLCYREKFAEAEPLMREALDVQRQQLGDDHEMSLRTLCNLAAVCQGLQRLEEAQRLLDDAIPRLRKGVGPSHPLTLRALNNQATLFAGTKRTQMAEPLQREALAGFRARLGDDHPQTQVARANLALMVRDLGRLEEAEQLLVEAVARSQATLGDSAPATANVQHQLAGVLLRRRQWAAAEPHLRAALASRTATLGDHLDTFSSMSRLAASLRGQQRFDEAEALLEDLIARQRKLLGDDHADTRRARADLEALQKARPK